MYRYSVVIPVYRNEENIRSLLAALTSLAEQLGHEVEVVFVIDGSPDRSLELLRSALPDAAFGAQLIAHSRNLGSFAAIRTGLCRARGSYIGVMAADLQEPPELLLQMFEVMSQGTSDIVFGQRVSRDDPLLQRLVAAMYWWLYRVLVLSDVPPGGVDVFACTDMVRKAILSQENSPGPLIIQLLWIGFRRAFVTYHRRRRLAGRSAWSLRKRLDYLLESVLCFTDRPIHALLWFGASGIVLSLIAAVVISAGSLSERISPPSYIVIILLLIFMGSVQSCGLGIVAFYLWHSLMSAQRRMPVIMSAELFDKPRQ